MQRLVEQVDTHRGAGYSRETGVGIRPDRGASTAFEDSDSDDDAFVTLSAVQAMARQRRPLEPSTTALNVELKLSQQMRDVLLPFLGEGLLIARAAPKCHHDGLRGRLENTRRSRQECAAEGGGREQAQ